MEVRKSTIHEISTAILYLDYTEGYYDGLYLLLQLIVLRDFSCCNSAIDLSCGMTKKWVLGCNVQCWSMYNKYTLCRDGCMYILL